MATDTSNFLTDLFGNKRVPNPPPGQSAYATGYKHYGAGRNMPNIGAVTGSGMLGYAQRDNEAKARKAAIMRRLQGQQTGNPMNLNVIGNGFVGAL